MTDDETAFDMVMPFIACRSNEGTYEDEPYIAGFEFGSIAARLYVGHRWPDAWDETEIVAIRPGNVEQIDLAAMRFGYRVVPVLDAALVVDGWVSVKIVKDVRPW